MEPGGSDERGLEYFDFDTVFEADDYLYFYDDTLRTEDTPAQIDFLERGLEMASPMRVLDAGCGHGRHAIELARRGHDVVGVDCVRGFLRIAERDAEGAGARALFVHGDLRTLAFDAEFDRAVCLFDVFGFFSDEENERILYNLASALRPGGRFCLDLRNRDWIVRNIPPITVLEKGADLMIDRHVFDTVTGRLVDRRILVRDGRVRHTPFSIRLYTLTELKAMLAGVGFSVDAAFGDWKGGPVGLHQNRLVVFATKR